MTQARTHDRRATDAGVSLLEMLVVLVILGTAVGAVTLALPRDTRAPGADREARLLQARLDRAVDASLAALTPARLTWEPGGYVFEEWTGEDWAQHSKAHLSRPRALPVGVSLDSAGSAVISPDLTTPEGGRLELVLRGARPVTVVFDGIATTTGAAP